MNPEIINNITERQIVAVQCPHCGKWLHTKCKDIEEYNDKIVCNCCWKEIEFKVDKIESDKK